jgi:hypothetical protein
VPLSRVFFIVSDYAKSNFLGSFLAYKRKMNGVTESDTILGDKTYTPEQMFFIGYGMVIKSSFIIRIFLVDVYSRNG